MEIEIGTGMANSNSDGYGLKEDMELNIGTNSLNVDTNQDNFTN